MPEATEACAHQAGGCGCAVLGFAVTLWFTLRAYYLHGLVSALGWFLIGGALIEAVAVWAGMWLIGLPLALIFGLANRRGRR